MDVVLYLQFTTEDIVDVEKSQVARFTKPGYGGQLNSKPH